MSDDELRDKLAEVAAREDHARAVDSGSARDAEWSDLTASDKRSWLDYEIVDALMPVVREALAEAWDDGLEHAGGGTLTDLKANPWRGEQP